MKCALNLKEVVDVMFDAIRLGMMKVIVGIYTNLFHVNRVKCLGKIFQKSTLDQ